MKNKIADVRDHLVAMLEALGEDDADSVVIERAKATALVADKYIGAVKVEIDARRILHESGIDLPPVLEAPARETPMRAIEGGKRA